MKISIEFRLKLTKYGFAIEEIHFKAEQMIVTLRYEL